MGVVTPIIRVQEAPLDLAAESEALAAGRTDVGGLASFVGLCRGDPGPDGPLAALVLEHYPGMTERALGRIAAEACTRWPLTGCTVIHRIGRLVPGDPIVLVLTASSHRTAALEACAFLIDWLKTGAPFWKREEFAGGPDRWVAARDSDDAAVARWSTVPSGTAPLAEPAPLTVPPTVPS